MRIVRFILGLLLIASFIFFIRTTNPHDGTNSLSGNLFSEILGIFVTVEIIERIIKANQEKERQKYQRIALLQLRKALASHRRMLSLMFTATVPSKPDKEYVKVADLFDDNYFEQTSRLDFLKPPPVIGAEVEEAWLLYVFHELNVLKEALNRTIDKYGIYLNLDTVETMENLINSQFYSVISNNINPYYDDKKRGIILPMDLLKAQPFLEQFKEHTRLFTKVVEQYNQLSDENKKITLN